MKRYISSSTTKDNPSMRKQEFIRGLLREIRQYNGQGKAKRLIDTVDIVDKSGEFVEQWFYDIFVDPKNTAVISRFVVDNPKFGHTEYPTVDWRNTASYGKGWDSDMKKFLEREIFESQISQDYRYYALAAYEEYDEGNIAYIDEDGIGYSIADIVISDSQSKAMRYFREQYDVTFGPEYYIVEEVDKSVVDEWLEPGTKIYSV